MREFHFHDHVNQSHTEPILEVLADLNNCKEGKRIILFFVMIIVEYYQASVLIESVDKDIEYLGAGK